MTLTRILDYEKSTKKFARYRPRVPEGDDPDVGVVYVRLDALGDTPMQSSLEMTLTPTVYDAQAAAAKGGKVAA